MSIQQEKIVFVLESFNIGGAERQAMLLGRLLQSQCNAHVLFISLTRGGAAESILQKDKIANRCLGLKMSYSKVAMLKNANALRKALKKENATIVMPYTYWPNVIAGNVWKLAGARLGLWNQRDAGIHVFNTFFERRAIKNAGVIVSNSYSGQRFLTSEFGVESDHVHIIPNGVELASAKMSAQEWEKEMDIAPQQKRVVMLANIQAKKDHATLVKAWAIVAEQFTDHKPLLILAGRHSGTQHKLRALAEELGVEAFIRLPGPVDDVAGLLSFADAMVHSSAAEGCPNSVLEAMVAGLPIIGTDIPGVRQALGEDSQYLVEVGNEAQMAEKIIEVLKEDQVIEELTAHNKKRVESSFSPQATLEKYLELFSQ
jgi:glycosyltransferase involved in cell wall biosynthesis